MLLLMMPYTLVALPLIVPYTLIALPFMNPYILQPSPSLCLPLIWYISGGIYINYQLLLIHMFLHDEVLPNDNQLMIDDAEHIL